MLKSRGFYANRHGRALIEEFVSGLLVSDNLVVNRFWGYLLSFFSC